MGFKKYEIFNVNNNIFGEDFAVYNYEGHEDKNIYYLKDSKDICNYKTKGMKIDIKDSCLSYEKFIKKYKIGMCV